VSIAGPGLVFLNGCAGLAGEPLRVSLVDLTSQPGQGMEWRMLARLRVQNPSGSEIRYEGLSVELTLRGQPFASGVAPLAGSIKPYSEAVLQVPLSVSGLAMLRQVLDLVREFSRDTPPGTAVKAPALPYSMRGRLGGFGGPSFESSGVVELPEFTASRPEVGTPAPK
jgi:hypothetical protein